MNPCNCDSQLPAERNPSALGTFANAHPWLTFFLASSLITAVATTIQVAIGKPRA